MAVPKTAAQLEKGAILSLLAPPIRKRTLFRPGGIAVLALRLQRPLRISFLDERLPSAVSASQQRWVGALGAHFVKGGQHARPSRALGSVGPLVRGNDRRPYL